MNHSGPYPDNLTSFHQPNQRHVISPQVGGFELETGVTGPTMLDCDLMQSHTALRKDSLASNSNTSMVSPTETHGWTSSFGNAAGRLSHMPVIDVASTMDSPANMQPPTFGQNVTHRLVQQHPLHHTWTFEEDVITGEPGQLSNDFTPRGSFDTSSFGHHHIDSPQTYRNPGETNPNSASSMETSFIPSVPLPTAISPHSHQDWMGMAQQEIEHRPPSKRMRPSSPPVTMVDFARRDGIRKKNGRIDIPAERNIHTIDDMIEKTTDEDLLKELKQQKRLLRNREAALASRQRKKKHTEDLEVKEKNYAQQVGMLEKEANDLALELQGREEERQIMLLRLQESQRLVESLQEQIRDLNIQHNEETSTLRKRINYLTDHMDLGGSAHMSAAPSSAGFADFNAEMEALNMGTHDWNDFGFAHEVGPDYNDFGYQSKSNPIAPTIAKREVMQDHILTEPPKTSDDAINSVDQPIASGLLFMLLLCGAFVASRPADSIAQDLPDMPADVRAAAPTVLNSLLAEASSNQAVGSQNAAPLISPGVSLAAMPYKSQNRLDRVHQELIKPTKQQEIEQAFSLTPSQYASISGMDHLTQLDQPSQPRHRRTLAETLAATQSGRQQTNRAEVFTRSLLWDQIPAEVVKQFKEMVRDHHEIEMRQNDQRNTETEFEMKSGST